MRLLKYDKLKYLFAAHLSRKLGSDDILTKHSICVRLLIQNDVAMLVQDSLNFSIYFYTEGLLIEYFIILILGIELSAVFIFQYVTRRGMSPKWILSFSATAIAFTSAALLYALKDLLFDTPSMRNFTYEMDLIIVSACSVASSYLMYDYFKMRGTRARVLSAGFFVFCVVSTIVSIIELFSTWNIQFLAVVLL